MNEIISGLLGGGIVLALTGIIWKLTNTKIDGKVNADLCEERRRGLDNKLAIIQTDIREIKVSQDKLASTVMEYMGQRRRESEE